MRIKGIKRGHHRLRIKPATKMVLNVEVPAPGRKPQRLVETFVGGIGGQLLDVRDAKRSHYYSALGRAR